MIPNKEGWDYLALIKLSRVLRGITSKHDVDFYCWNCFILLEQRIESNLMKKYVKINIFVES